MHTGNGRRQDARFCYTTANQSYSVSLADAARLSGTLMKPGDSAHLDASAVPTLGDLAECLFFSPGDGRIWLNDQRMLLLHSAAFGALRRELIECVGTEHARRLLTRAGYASGARDAALVRQRWPDADGASILAAGTRLHALEGVVKVEPVHFSFDAESGCYDGEFLWHHSSEADEHIAAYGLGSEPVCWMELGYAIGYVTGLTGTLVIFREVECRAMGSAVCRVVGRNAARWDDVADDLRYLDAPAGSPKPRPLRVIHAVKASSHAAQGRACGDAPSGRWPCRTCGGLRRGARRDDACRANRHRGIADR
jgi:predicted hydrocarbon binding protein